MGGSDDRLSERPAQNEHGLRVSVSPAQEPLPFLTDSEERVVAGSFQAKLLRYRMVHYERVRVGEVDCRAFVPEMRDLVRTRIREESYPGSAYSHALIRSGAGLFALNQSDRVTSAARTGNRRK
jgi:hypothetical protein